MRSNSHATSWPFLANIHMRTRAIAGLIGWLELHVRRPAGRNETHLLIACVLRPDCKQRLAPRSMARTRGRAVEGAAVNARIREKRTLEQREQRPTDESTKQDETADQIVRGSVEGL
jgi:hypothetical protein